MKNHQLIMILLFLTWIAGCGATSPEPRDLSVLTVATVGDHVLVGQANSFGFHGNFTISSLTSPKINCKGKFRYRDRASRGKARYTCDNDMSGTLMIVPEGPLQGRGDGETKLGPIKALFGYRLAKVNEMLNFPDDNALVYVDGDFSLIQRRESR